MRIKPETRLTVAFYELRAGATFQLSRDTINTVYLKVPGRDCCGGPESMFNAVIISGSATGDLALFDLGEDVCPVEYQLERVV